MQTIFEKIYDWAASRINPTVVFFFIYAIILVSPLLYSGVNALETHDFHFHKHIIQQMGIAFQGGQFPARIAPDMAYGFGYGVGIFYPPLAHWVGYIFSLIPGFDVHMASAAVYFMIYFFSGYAFYKMMLYIGRTPSAAAIGGLLYMSMPYLIINVIYRDAYAEAFCFMLLPLIVIGLSKLAREKKFMMLTLSFSAIVMTHNITAIYTFIFMAIGCLIYYKHFIKRDVIIAGLKAAGLTALLSLVAIVPIIEHRFFAPDVVYHIFGTAENLKTSVHANALQFGQLIYWPFGQTGMSWSLFTEDYHNQLFHNRMPIFIGAHMLLLFLAAILWPSSKQTLRGNLPSIFAAVLLLFATTAWFPWRLLPYFLLNIQFPWRLLFFAGFLICIVAADSFSKMSVRNIKFPMIIIAIIGVYYTVRIASPIPVKPKITPEAAAVIGVDWAVEYNPSPFIWKSGPLLARGNKPLMQHGHARVSNFERDRAGRLSFDINATDGAPDLIELPLFYYKGYQVLFNSKILPNFANERGLVTIRVSESGHIKTRYVGTMADRIATAISFITLLGIIGYAVVSRRRFTNKSA